MRLRRRRRRWLLRPRGRRGRLRRVRCRVRLRRFSRRIQKTALQLGRMDDLMDMLSPAYADASGMLHARNQYQQAGAETYRLGQSWRGPLAGEKGAAPEFRAGDIVLLDGREGSRSRRR